jgi:hypothetical protein
MDKILGRINERFDALEALIREEGEMTRRLFDVMIERIEAAVKPVAESLPHLQAIIDNHEARRKNIEKRAAR